MPIPRKTGNLLAWRWPEERDHKARIVFVAHSMGGLVEDGCAGAESANLARSSDGIRHEEPQSLLRPHEVPLSWLAGPPAPWPVYGI